VGMNQRSDPRTLRIEVAVLHSRRMIRDVVGAAREQSAHTALNTHGGSSRVGDPVMIPVVRGGQE